MTSHRFTEDSGAIRGEPTWTEDQSGPRIAAPPQAPLLLDERPIDRRDESLSIPPLAMQNSDLRVTDRYDFRSVLGEGGMGEIRLVWDRLIQREVAMKVLLPARAKKARATARFYREANVQGLLDHPAIVPLYDMGLLPSGEPYFTMKRVRGVTLLEVLEGMRRDDPRVTSRFNFRRVLSAFSSTCLAIDHAHLRGIVHRDLKPENLMLGDYGEVYVLDWGLSRLIDPMHSRLPSTPEFGRATLSDANDLIGTPGYMAPEQIDASDAVQGPSDVYALGAILFEILTLIPLHAGTSSRERLLETQTGADARCSVRAPERNVPKELETWCVRATQPDPARRPQARQFHEAMEAFLEVDRDAERRRVVSDLHLRTARESAARVLHGEAGPKQQREAIRGYSKALAADSRNEDAMRGLYEILEAPLPVPDEARILARSEERRLHRITRRSLRWGRASWLLYMPLSAWMGVADRAASLVMLAAIVVAVASSLALERAPDPKPWARNLAAMISLLAVAPLGLYFSPLIQVPAVLAASITVLSLDLDRRGRALAVITACLTALGPLALEWAGWMAPSVVLDGHTITILPRLTRFPVTPTWAMLIAMMLGPILTMPLLMARIRRELAGGRLRVHGHAWRLRQLLPRPRRRRGDSPNSGRSSSPPAEQE